MIYAQLVRCPECDGKAFLPAYKFPPALPIGGSPFLPILPTFNPSHISVTILRTETERERRIERKEKIERQTAQ